MSLKDLGGVADTLPVSVATRRTAYKGRLRARPAAQRIYINALRSARGCVCGKYVYVKYDIIIQYKYDIERAPAAVLLVLHTAKRVVTTGALCR